MDLRISRGLDQVTFLAGYCDDEESHSGSVIEPRTFRNVMLLILEYLIAMETRTIVPTAHRSAAVPTWDVNVKAKRLNYRQEQEYFKF